MKLTQKLLACLLLVGLVIGFTSCDDDDDEMRNTFETVKENGNLSTLTSLLEQTGLDEVLATGTYTLFAPSDAAFTAANLDVANLTNEQISDLLLYHVIIGSSIASTDLIEGDTYASTGNTTGPNETALSIFIRRTGSSVAVNKDANVTTANETATNGVIHIIDKVLMPLDVVGHAAANDQFTELVGALSNPDVDLVPALQADGPFTVFAPVNSAFESISGIVEGLTADQLSQVLQYHVLTPANIRAEDLMVGDQTPETLQGSNITVNRQANGTVTVTDSKNESTEVVIANVQATNGVIHVITEVLLPF